MSLQTYWLVFAPALLIGLSGFGWLALWLTRHRETRERIQVGAKPPLR